MLQLAYVTEDSKERSVSSDGDVIRFGSDPSCELQVTDVRGTARVAARHGEFVREKGAYVLRARNADSGVWVDGKRVERVALKGGERIRVGSPKGPEIRVVRAAVDAEPASPFEENDVTVQVSPAQLRAMQTAQGPKRDLAAPAPASRPGPPVPSTPPPPSPVSRRRTRSPEATPAVPSRAEATRTAPRPPPAAPPSVPSPKAAAAKPRDAQPPVAPPGSVQPAAAEARAAKVVSAKPPPQAKGSAERKKGPGIDAPATFRRAVKALKRPQEEVQQWLQRAQREIRRARAKTNGQSSGQTMVIMASALAGIRQHAEGRAQRWRRKLLYLGAVSAVVVVALLGVIWFQQRQISGLVAEKAAIDSQIQSVFAAMASETDEQKLVELETRLQTLMGTATEKVVQVSQQSQKRAQELAKPADELEAEIRHILRSFNAETYAIPPLFKQELQRHIAELKATPALRQAYARKQRHWPKIQRALQRHQLPEELGYIAFTESTFDPTAVNARSGASGMWQLMDETASKCGISVGKPKDERFDPARSSDAAACYLSKLLIEFGEESFMLALASYNRGENGVRRALHKVAREPGGYKKRDFWHLYRLKLLPEETREYVPKVLAAAIVFREPEKYGLGPAR